MAPLCTEDDFYAASTKHLEKNHEEICQSENRDGEIKIHVDHRAATADRLACPYCSDNDTKNGK